MSAYSAAMRLAGRTERQDNGCLLYTGGYAARSGHVQMWHEGRMVGVHRVAWTLENGPVPDGLCVCHRCDTPRCVEPSHLFLGTVADNNADRDSKGRGVPPTGAPKQAGPIKHGTLAAYVHRKCRCEPCRQANSAYRAKGKAATA